MPRHGMPSPIHLAGRLPQTGQGQGDLLAGCHDALDILPALNMTVSDLFDDPTAVRTTTALDPHIQARIEARRNMNAPQRQLDNLIHVPDIGTRLVLAIAQHRPELYIAAKYGLDINGGDA
jgi:hypothetical protein